MPADLTREEIAAGVRLEGWRWMPGMLCSHPSLGRWRAGEISPPSGFVPEPGDPATAGCLLDLLCPAAHLVRFVPGSGWQWFDGTDWHDAPNLGAACFRAALARGRWG